jgi:hypothetical protein
MMVIDQNRRRIILYVIILPFLTILLTVQGLGPAVCDIGDLDPPPSSQQNVNYQYHL